MEVQLQIGTLIHGHTVPSWIFAVTAEVSGSLAIASFLEFRHICPPLHLMQIMGRILTKHAKNRRANYLTRDSPPGISPSGAALAFNFETGSFFGSGDR
jgi:hypothetical protein